VKVYAYPADEWGCGHYRVSWPAQAVSIDSSWDVTIVEPGARAVDVEVDLKGRVVAERFPADADVIVLQRPTSPFVQQAVPLLARRCAVVIDMDDDLAHIHPRNPAFNAMSGRGFYRHPVTGQPVPNLHSWKHAAQACRDATLVTVTTRALAKRYGRAGAVRVIPNMVPAQYLDLPREDSAVVGWGGSVHSHPDDLQQVGGAVASLVRSGVAFSTVGDPEGVSRALGLSDDDWDAVGPVTMGEWPRAIARFGVGVAPLADTVFNQAKSRLKPLEYAAVGVIPVVSGVEDYRLFAKQGGCIIADRPRSWESAIRPLVADPARRADMSGAVREVAAMNTFEANAFRWADAWQEAVDLQRREVPAGAA